MLLRLYVDIFAVENNFSVLFFFCGLLTINHSRLLLLGSTHLNEFDNNVTADYFFYRPYFSVTILTTNH